MTLDQSIEFPKLIIKAKKEAIAAFKHFYNDLGLDSNNIKYLDNLRITIGKTNKNAPAQYNIDNFSININEHYLAKALENIKSNNNHNEIYQDILINLIHEMIHANRTLRKSNGLSILSIGTQVEKELEAILRRKKYDKLLKNIEKNNDPKKYRLYIPIIINENEDNTYTVIAYDKKNKEYVKFSNQIFDICGKNISYQITQELNDENKTYEYIRIDKTIINNDGNDTLVACDFDHEFEGRLIIDIKSTFNMDQSKIKELIYERANYIVIKLNKQSDFEEVLTETISIIMVKSKSKEFSFDNITKELIESDISIDLKEMAKILQTLGIDIVKWYMTSTYETNYTNELYNIFNDKYEELLNAFSQLYYHAIKKCELSNEEIEEISKTINKIIKEKTIKPKK